MDDVLGWSDSSSGSLEVVGCAAAPPFVVSDAQGGWGCDDDDSPAANIFVDHGLIGDACSHFASIPICFDIPDTQVAVEEDDVVGVGVGVGVGFAVPDASVFRVAGVGGVTPKRKSKAKATIKVKAKQASAVGRFRRARADEQGEVGCSSSSGSVGLEAVCAGGVLPMKRGRPAVSKEKLQGKLRSRKFRARVASEKKLKRGEECDLLPLLVGEPYRTSKYTLENVRWIVKLGTCPSAGGARAPLAGVVSHVTCSVSRFAVELHRSRMHRYMLRAEDKIWREFIRDRSVGVVLKFDETPMKLCTDGFLFQSVPVLVRCISGFDVDANVVKRCPDLRRPARTDAAGIFARIGLGDLGIAVSFASGPRWRVVVVNSDGAAVNKSVFKMIIWKLRRQKRTLILHSLCYKHHLSNATRWSISSVPYGLHLRLSHFLQTRPIRDVTSHCEKMIGNLEYVEDFISEDEAREVWPLLLQYLVGPSNALSAVVNPARLEDMSAMACKLFPSLPPMLGSCWCAGTGTVGEFNTFLSKLFGKCPPVPIITRWFTMERFCWHVLGLRMMSMLGFLFPADAELHFWPGDDALAAADGQERYHARSSKRMQKLRDYLESESFPSDLLLTCISSIPRWHMARSLESDRPSCPGETQSSGVTQAMSRLLDDTFRILAGKDRLVEYLLRRECGRDNIIRMRACRALTTTILYLGEKNRGNCSNIWKVIRGEMTVEAMLDAGCNQCCADDGATAKIFAALAGLDGGARSASINLLKEALSACGKIVTTPGGEDNLECESRFSRVRFLGLKTPFRPPKLSTMRRELGNQYFAEEQRAWAKDVMESVYGGLQNARLLLASRKNVVFNGFTAFVRNLGRVVTECDVVWQRLSEDTKHRWAEEARRLNSESNTLREAERRTPPPECASGPLGSRDSRCPVDIDALHSALNGDDPELPNIWRKAEIRTWKMSLDDITAPSCWPAEDMCEVRSLKLPGQSCVTCAAVETAARSQYASMRATLLRCYDRHEGAEHGLTVGLCVSHGVLWYEIPCVSRRPVKLFAYPLEVVESRETQSAELGDVIRTPAAARPLLGSSFTEVSMCLVDICARLHVGAPGHVVVPMKSGMVNDLDGWTFTYSDVYTVEHVQPQPRAPVPRARPDPPPVATTGARAVYDAVFGEIVPSEGSRRDVLFGEHEDALGSMGDIADAQFLGEPDTVVSEDDDFDMGFRAAAVDSLSDEELATKLGMCEDDRVDITARVKGAIDSSKYAVFASSSTGSVTVFWRVSEKNKHRATYKEAIRKLATMSDAKKLRASRSALLSLHGLDGCLHRCSLWSQWRRAWVYMEQPTLVLPRSMPLPPSMAGGDVPNSGPMVARAASARNPPLDDHPKAPAPADDPFLVSESDEDASSAMSSDGEPLVEDSDTSSMSSTSVGSIAF